MKKLTLSLLIAFSMTVANAQTPPPATTPAPTTPVQVEIVQPAPAKPASGAQTYEKFNIGLQVTPMLKWINTDSKNVETDGVKMGFAYGLVTEIFFAPKYAFYTGIEFAYRGGNIIVQDSIKQDVHLQYLEIPLCLQMHTKEKNNLSFFARFGTSACFSIKSFYENEDDEKVSINSDVAFYNMAFKIGGGAQYSIDGGSKLYSGIIFNNGIMNVFESSSNKSFNMSVDLNIGIYF